MGAKVSLGRRASPHLQNLHISREQVVIELKPDVTGRILICMTNVRTVPDYGPARPAPTRARPPLAAREEQHARPQRPPPEAGPRRERDVLPAGPWRHH